MDDFELRTMQIINDCTAGRIPEKEARGRLAREFCSSDVARTTVRRFDGTNGRLMMYQQTFADVENELSNLIVELTLNPERSASFKFQERANYAGWARQLCRTAAPRVAKTVRRRNFRHVGLPEERELPWRPSESARPAVTTVVEFDEDSSMRARLALDDYEVLGHRALDSSRQQLGAAALLAYIDAPPMARLDRRDRHELQQLVAQEPCLPFRMVQQAAEGGDFGPLTPLFPRWSAEDAERLARIGDQERRRAGVALVVNATIADYPRPLRAAIKNLEAEVRGFSSKKGWRSAGNALVAAFIDTECEAVAARNTAVNTEAREQEHRDNIAAYPQILAEAAAIAGCSIAWMERATANAAFRHHVIGLVPARCLNTRVTTAAAPAVAAEPAAKVA